MTLLLDGGLRALIHLSPPKLPPELLVYLASRKQLDSEDTLNFCESELHTRLFLYALIFKKDISTVPEVVAAELKNNLLSCLALLLNVQWRLGATRSVTGTLRQLLSEEVALMPEDSRRFIGEQVVHLVLDNPDGTLLSAVEDVREALQLPERLERIVRLANLVADYQPHQPPATISPLRSLTSTDGEAAVAAHYLLARIYRDLRLPLEEKECYSSWMVGLAQCYKRAAADLAGSVSRDNPAMECQIVRGAKRWLQLLMASGASIEVNQVVDEFQKAGYKDEFEPLRIEQARQTGYQCRLVARDEASEEMEMKALISEILTSGPRQGACLILRDESGAEVEKFPLASSTSPEREMLMRLPDHLSKASLMVLPDIVEENLFQKRRWVVCFDQTKPMDALAVGILPMETEFSVVYARAIVFDTKLDPEKDQGWFQATIRLLGQAFDAQKTGVIRDAVRRVADQISTGQSNVQVLEL